MHYSLTATYKNPARYSIAREHAGVSVSLDTILIITIMGLVAFALCLLFSIITGWGVWKLHYKPFFFICVGVCEIGLSFLIDIVAINLPFNALPAEALHYFRIDAILGIFGLSATTYGFLHTQKNTPLYTERLIIYNFIFGIAVASYLLDPNFSVQWVQGIGWAYVSLPLGMMILDQIIFLPVLELIFHAIRRLRAPFRTRKCRLTVLLFSTGLVCLIGSNLIAYFTDFIYYLGLAIGFGLMGYAFLRDPLILTITHVKIYDLVVSVNAFAVARFNFEKKEAIRSEHLFSGAFSGMSTLIGETISTKKELKLLQTEDKTVLMHKSKEAKIYIVTDRRDDVCLLAMKRLGRFVDDYYQKRNEIFYDNIDPTLFERAVLEIFTFA